MLHHLQILGEATHGLPQSVRDQAPEIPWGKIAGMRNVLVHQYFGVDQEIVWSVVERDLPSLKAQIASLLSRIDEPG